MPTVEQMKHPAIVTIAILYAYHHGMLNFLFSTPSQAGIKKTGG